MTVSVAEDTRLQLLPILYPDRYGRWGCVLPGKMAGWHLHSFSCLLGQAVSQPSPDESMSWSPVMARNLSFWAAAVSARQPSILNLVLPWLRVCSSFVLQYYLPTGGFTLARGLSQKNKDIWFRDWFTVPNLAENKTICSWNGSNGFCFSARCTKVRNWL